MRVIIYISGMLPTIVESMIMDPRAIIQWAMLKGLADKLLKC
jgi:hypothetical protein